ncbi:hypothetical protein [Melittangium boletus]|uniref:hypothetical protein n=1 Tax=Melittangium boletus TaxID=83453 RepID=UPI003DA57C32
MLYGDLLIEWPGIGEDESFEGFEKLGKLHRKLYFFRASSVTLQSCVHLLDQLMSNKSLKEWFERDTAAKARFLDSKKEFDRHKQVIARLRNELGAHAEQDVGRAISRFSPDEVASIELHSKDLLRPHLATNILIHAILRNCPKGSEEKEFRKAIISINAAQKAMAGALSEFLGMYAKNYPLFASRA